jgi:cytochrome c oxidase assembly protein subunit 15
MTAIAFMQLALIGLAVAAIFFAVAWLKSKTFTFHRLVLLTTFFTFDLILFGAFTRLTDSGLGCPDWPGCYGLSNPWAAIHDIRAAEIQMPSGPVTLSKAWIEMLHRYFAMGVGCLIIGMVAWSFIKRHSTGIRDCWASLGILLLVCVQGAFGAWTVTLKLQPIIVTTHLLLGLTLVASLAIFSMATSPIRAGFVNKFSGTNLLNWLIGALIILGAQIFLGAWVSTNYAVLACEDFPTCQGVWWPAMDFSNGFHLWRDLGQTQSGQLLSLEALRAIHWTHRLGAVVTLMILIYVGLKSLKVSVVHGCPIMRRWSFALLALSLAQLLTGMSNVILDWPLLAALMHTGGAAALLIVIVSLSWMAYRGRS